MLTRNFNYTSLSSLLAKFLIFLTFFLSIVDDPLDSSPVHFGGGFWSILALPLMRNGGIAYQSLPIVLEVIVDTK